MGYILPKPFLGYDEGFELRDVTLREARAMECNRCGDCCDGLREDVKKDEITGLPLSVWGSQFPKDLYEKRYGKRLLQPIVMVDGGIDIGEKFEINSDGKPHTCFSCSMLVNKPEGEDGPETGCAIYQKEREVDASKKENLKYIRPRACGDFPVFGAEASLPLVDGHTFVPPTGAFPRCTWYGIRIIGPYREEPYWQDRWEKQQKGEEVAPLPPLDPKIIKALLARRATIDGSRPKRGANSGKKRTLRHNKRKARR